MADRQTLLGEMVDAFETRGGMLRRDALTSEQLADVQQLIFDGLAECRPPGRLGDADYIIPTAKARNTQPG